MPFIKGICGYVILVPINLMRSCGRKILGSANSGSDGTSDTSIDYIRINTICRRDNAIAVDVCKLSWVKEHEPKTYQKIDKILVPGDYISMKLTGTVTTTPSAHSEGILWDLRSHGPHERLLSGCGFEKKSFRNLCNRLFNPAITAVTSVHGRENPDSPEAKLNEALTVSYFKAVRLQDRRMRCFPVVGIKRYPALMSSSLKKKTAAKDLKRPMQIKYLKAPISARLLKNKNILPATSTFCPLKSLYR